MNKIIKQLFIIIVCLFAVVLSVNAQWMKIGQVDYKWGFFHIYTISLFSETGQYEDNQRPLMLTLKYQKPVEGKNFAITLSKSIAALERYSDEELTQWRQALMTVLPDFQPEDSLSYIALLDKGYFVLNDTVLDKEFDANFNAAFTAIWLDPNSNFKRLQPELLGKVVVPDAEIAPQIETEPTKLDLEKHIKEQEKQELEPLNDAPSEPIQPETDKLLISLN